MFSVLSFHLLFLPFLTFWIQHFIFVEQLMFVEQSTYTCTLQHFSFTTTFPPHVRFLWLQIWKNVIHFSKLNIHALTFRISLDASGKDPASCCLTIVSDCNWSGQNVILMLYILCYICYKLDYILNQIVSPLFFCPYWFSIIMIVNSHQLQQGFNFLISLS